MTRESLAHRISDHTQPEVLVRLRLSLGVANALDAVHSLGLIHKSLRSRAILVLSDPKVQISNTPVYLQDWTYIRELSGATTQLGEDSWQKALYQHPERQGRYAEAAYQFKHDIYSLGANMLEVLFWTPFVPSSSGAHEPFRMCNLFESIGISPGEGNGGLPERYKGNTLKLNSRPRATKAIWCQIARSELPNGDLQDLILECLDGAYQNVSDVVKSIEKMIGAREQVN